MAEPKIIRVSGPLVVAEGMNDARMFDVVRVGSPNLVGEIIELRGDRAWIQVYEDTGGIGPGEPVKGTGEPLSVELGPGLIGAIYDGVQRPLERLFAAQGVYIRRGTDLPGLQRDRKWPFEPLVKKGDALVEGDVIGKVAETPLVEHRVLVPPGVRGSVLDIRSGEFTVDEVVCVLKNETGDRELTMMQRWPVRQPRPYVEKLHTPVPLLTGQRVIDTLFPVRQGGTACVPGPFGSGKTVVQHQLAKWADAQIIVYIGCGERGNEMADVLLEFPELKDPRSGRSLMERTVLVANTSNMPVAAREASIYTGITIAEYLRDMGYTVAVMADSTSRWAEAMREMSGRLEEMPGEEGYPAYLARRIAGFYERSGKVVCLGSDRREGSLSVVGAVSPPGGDLSDTVVQSTLRVVKVFWSLEDTLAARRHFPAISWLTSYSLYQDDIASYLDEKVDGRWSAVRRRLMAILQEEASLQEIVRLVGLEGLSAADRVTMEVAKAIREDFLHQNAFDDIDTYTSIEKQFRMIDSIHTIDVEAHAAVERGVELDDVLKLGFWEELPQMRFIPEDQFARFDALQEKIRTDLQQAVHQAGGS
ncbi:MAG: V-type ATP synthase subunit A [Planctomycetota bacterium]